MGRGTGGFAGVRGAGSGAEARSAFQTPARGFSLKKSEKEEIIGAFKGSSREFLALPSF
jgi:hypothetical protein